MRCDLNLKNDPNCKAGPKKKKSQLDYLPQLCSRTLDLQSEKTKNKKTAGLQK